MMVVTRLGSPKSWDEVPGKTVPNPTRPGGNGMIDFVGSKGIVGLCREAAIHNSPGLLALGMRSARCALKVAADVRFQALRVLSYQRVQYRVPLSGHLSLTA
jgi:hypothetical protein